MACSSLELQTRTAIAMNDTQPLQVETSEDGASGTPAKLNVSLQQGTRPGHNVGGDRIFFQIDISEGPDTSFLSNEVPQSTPHMVFES